MEKKHILLLTDLSEEAQRAFQPVSSLARTVGARVTLLHVVQILTKVPPGSMLTPPAAVGDPKKERLRAQDALEEQATLLEPSLEVELEVVVNDDVAEAVVEYADRHEVGLIALSTHGRSGLRRLFLGSVAEAILRHARIPVLCFPPQGQG